MLKDPRFLTLAGTLPLAVASCTPQARADCLHRLHLLIEAWVAHGQAVPPMVIELHGLLIAQWQGQGQGA